MSTVNLELYGYDLNTSLVFNYLLDHINRLSAKEIMVLSLRSGFIDSRR
ncbi:MAG: hypothetical protein ACFFCZ_01705 [Promethearchaeota archaeon]